ncbi:hypothetical protein CBR_g3409 [Chara braunii]|uniref:Integrase catalytic domain-containing protein n=1 Tax=Chara braunii TaxID=69332 RepID=A0A388JQU6_CHABU|nr:hypothetical protein CBR_g3409 [Chara braunii]|eukprot:GBG60165.1 hypothetical protein CBR_g3409 [Chara braunii]
MVHREYYRAFLEMGPFNGEQRYEVLRILRAVFTTRPRAPVVSDEVLWGIVRGEACDRPWSLRERVLGWFDPEGTPKAGEKQRDSKEGEGTSAVGEAGSSEGGLKRIVATLTRALNKNQGYLADAKKKLTFDGANITEFLIDYENLVALLKWSEEEKMDHLGQHVSLSLGRDIMAIVASSGSWKETRNEMMRKYLKVEQMTTEAELAAVQRKNYATYNDFLRAFTLVALRIPGVTDRIMSKYFLRQDSEFDKDKILSAYQQTSKFKYTRDVDFSTVTDLAEKTVVTETLALLKEGEVIDLNEKTGDKVKKGIESLHERVHGVDNKIERVENALLVMQTQVSRPALPPQEAVVPATVANQGYGRRDPANEQCKYCTMIGYFVWTYPRLNHDIMRQRCSTSLKGEIFGPQGERINWNSPGGMRRAVIILNNLNIAIVEAEPVANIVWDQPRGRGPQVNFIIEGNGQDRVNITTRRTRAGKKLIRDTVMKEVAGTSANQGETEIGEPEKAYGKAREEEPIDKAVAPKNKFRYQIPILTMPEIDDTLSKLLGTMVSVSFQTMLQASPRLLKDLRQLPTRRRVEVAEAPKLQEQETEEAEAAQGVSNLQRIPGDLEDREKTFADIRLSLPDREGGEVMRAPPGTKLSFHALLKGRLDAKLISSVRIHTVEHECWNDKGPAYDFGIAAKATKLLRAKIDSFVAEPSASPYANKWFVFRKPNKTIRWIQDLQKLNVVTIRDAGSLSQTDLLAESHAGRSVYSLIDLYPGYGQLSLDARDKPYTAMHTPVEQLQMQVTPMGFTNVVAEAQRRMLAVAGDMFPEKCEPYIDDNPIKGAQNKDETKVQPGIRKYILDARDNLSDYVEAVALKRKTGNEVADWIADFYLRHPFVRRFIADNGTEFVNHEVLSRLKILCVPITIIEPYHPEANAPVERGHRTLKNTIAKLAADDLGNWPRYLKQAAFSENMTPKRTTGCISVELWYGRGIYFSVEALVPTWNRLDDNPHISTEELIAARCQQVIRNEEALEDVVKRVMDSRMRDKAR